MRTTFFLFAAFTAATALTSDSTNNNSASQSSSQSASQSSSQSASQSSSSSASQSASQSSSQSAGQSSSLSLASQSTSPGVTSRSASVSLASEAPPFPSTFPTKAANVYESLVYTLESIQNSYVSENTSIGATGTPTLPTNAAVQTSFVLALDSFLSGASATVATATGPMTSQAKAFVTEIAKAVSKFESSWSVTPSAASTATASNSSTSSHKGGAPLVTAAPIVVGGVAVAALALL